MDPAEDDTWKIYVPAAVVVSAFLLITCCAIAIIARNRRKVAQRNMDYRSAYSAAHPTRPGGPPVVCVIEGSGQVAPRQPTQPPVTHQNARFTNPGQGVENKNQNINSNFGIPNPGFQNSPGFQNIPQHPFQNSSDPGLQNNSYPPAVFQNSPNPPGFHIPPTPSTLYSPPAKGNVSSTTNGEDLPPTYDQVQHSEGSSSSPSYGFVLPSSDTKHP